MKSRLSKVYSKMPKEKIELEKVELGLSDDLGKEISKLEKAIVADKEFKKLIAEYNKKQSSLVKEIQKMEVAKDKLEQKGEKIFNVNNDLVDKLDNILDKTANAAKELGVKPDAIPNYKKVQTMSQKLGLDDITDSIEQNIYF